VAQLGAGDVAVVIAFVVVGATELNVEHSNWNVPPAMNEATTQQVEEIQRIMSCTLAKREADRQQPPAR
jgi:hypothetical protein